MTPTRLRETDGPGNTTKNRPSWSNWQDASQRAGCHSSNNSADTHWQSGLQRLTTTYFSPLPSLSLSPLVDRLPTRHDLRVPILTTVPAGLCQRERFSKIQQSSRMKRNSLEALRTDRRYNDVPNRNPLLGPSTASWALHVHHSQRGSRYAAVIFQRVWAVILKQYNNALNYASS